MPQLNLFALIAIISLLAVSNPVKTQMQYSQKQGLSDWKLTVYYTPVEKYHAGDMQQILGCTQSSCAEGQVSLGEHPSSFLEIVRLEGVGRLTEGTYAGSYLHWTPQMGYWLTAAPLDAQGNTLIPFRSAASDATVKFGTEFKIVDCGVRLPGGQSLSWATCEQIMNRQWVVTDRFHDDSKPKHIDLYIGEEDRENFLYSNPFVFSLEKANILLLNQ